MKQAEKQFIIEQIYVKGMMIVCMLTLFIFDHSGLAMVILLAALAGGAYFAWMKNRGNWFLYSKTWLFPMYMLLFIIIYTLSYISVQFNVLKYVVALYIIVATIIDAVREYKRLFRHSETTR